MRKIKVYSLDGGSLSWIKNSEQTHDPSKADLIILEGGADWSPSLYNQRANGYCHWFNPRRDADEMGILKFAIQNNIATFGICRGMQGQTIANNGTLVQHISHPGQHNITLYDGSVMPTNSLHHQLCNPYDLPEENYKVLGWSNGLSPVYIGENDETVSFNEAALLRDGRIKEPEIIFYPKTKCLGVQFHPEMMNPIREIAVKCNELIEELLITGTIAS